MFKTAERMRAAVTVLQGGGQNERLGKSERGIEEHGMLDGGEEGLDHSCLVTKYAAQNPI